jgi:hypothetical protein
MDVTVPPGLRVAIYVLNVLGAPVVVYLRAKHVIGDLELTLWGAEVSAMALLAGFHVPASMSRDQRGQADAFALLQVLTFVGVVLLLFGVRFR